jgi:hypothetical protein
MGTEDMPWYAIRTVYLFGAKSDGKNVFEERMVVFEADTPDRAHERAELESEQYTAQNGLIAHPEQMAYHQDGTALVDGYEVWSELFEDDSNLEDFYAKRYGRFEYHPELPDA